MNGTRVLSLLAAFSCLLEAGQAVGFPRAGAKPIQPGCAKGAICFSGEVREGTEFRKHLTSRLDFVLTLPGGVDVVSIDPRDRCKLSAWVANPPLLAHHETEIDAAYDWTAEQEVRVSLRDFRFATSCAAFERLFDLSQTDTGKYLAELPSLAKGHGRLWITASKVTHSHGIVDKKNGAILWMSFSAEMELTAPR